MEINLVSGDGDNDGNGGSISEVVMEIKLVGVVRYYVDDGDDDGNGGVGDSR